MENLPSAWSNLDLDLVWDKTISEPVKETDASIISLKLTGLLAEYLKEIPASVNQPFVHWHQKWDSCDNATEYIEILEHLIKQEGASCESETSLAEYLLAGIPKQHRSELEMKNNTSTTVDEELVFSELRCFASQPQSNLQKRPREEDSCDQSIMSQPKRTKMSDNHPPSYPEIASSAYEATEEATNCKQLKNKGDTDGDIIMMWEDEQARATAPKVKVCQSSSAHSSTQGFNTISADRSNATDSCSTQTSAEQAYQSQVQISQLRAQILDDLNQIWHCVKRGEWLEACLRRVSCGSDADQTRSQLHNINLDDLAAVRETEMQYYMASLRDLETQIRTLASQIDQAMCAVKLATSVGHTAFSGVAKVGGFARDSNAPAFRSAYHHGFRA